MNVTIEQIQIRYATTAHQAECLVRNGWTPVECNFGDYSVVDDLMMDHHGELSNLEPVGIRAYRDHFGACAEDPRFVVTGAPDADQTFAVLALAGALPHPSREIRHPGEKYLQKDLTEMAELIAKLDRDPIGVDKTESEFGKILITWGAMHTGIGDGLPRTQMAVSLMFRMLTGGVQHLMKPYFDAAHQQEAERREMAAKDEVIEEETAIPVVNDSPVWGYDVWYARLGEETDSQLPEGWKRPVLIAYQPKINKISFGCPNKAVAETLFGEGGLLNVFPLLGEGWGGHEAGGGSPRGQKYSLEDAKRLAREVFEMINS